MKNCKEWSIEFDQAWNNISSNQAPGLNIYDKSRVLTKAQESVVIGICNGTLRSSFEETEEMTKYLSALVSQASCLLESSQTIPRISDKSVVYTLPSDLLFRTLEICVITHPDCGDREVIVVPTTQDEYWRTHRDPFKKQNENRVLRLSHSKVNQISVIADYSEIISDYPVKSYTVRYIRRPEPIILADLANGLSINGKNTAQTCLLDEALHQTILAEAVRLAKAEWVA